MGKAISDQPRDFPRADTSVHGELDRSMLYMISTAQNGILPGLDLRELGTKGVGRKLEV